MPTLQFELMILLLMCFDLDLLQPHVVGPSPMVSHQKPDVEIA